MRRAILASGACFVFATTGLAEDKDLAAKWATVEGWDIRIDESMNNGCFITTVYEGNTFLRLGYEPGRGEAYMMLGNDAWKSIEADKEYPIELKLDNDASWTAKATGSKIGTTPMLYVFFKEFEFLDDVRRKRRIAVTFEGKSIAKLNLFGSSAALLEMLNCQKSVNSMMANQPKSDDPFEKTTTEKAATDPFSI